MLRPLNPEPLIIDPDLLYSKQVTARLQTMLRPFLLRRLKSDVEAGLPDKTQVHLAVPLSRMQRNTN